MDASALALLDRMALEGQVTKKVHQSLRETLAARQHQAAERLEELDAANRAYQHERMIQVEKQLLDRRKAKLGELYRDGVVSSDTYARLASDLNSELAALESKTGHGH
jgi:hypothetical protein